LHKLKARRSFIYFVAYINYLDDARLILKGYMALEQAFKPLFFMHIFPLIKGVCTLSLLSPAESQILALAIRPTLM
jgi:hypothetical protein